MLPWQPTIRACDNPDDKRLAVERILRREADLVLLCSRGARMPTINSLLGKVSESQIKRINRLCHGNRKGAKTRGLEYYTESIERRRDASLIVSWHRRLEKTEEPLVQRYVQLHSIHLETAGAQPPFDIDETIRLTCAVELGELRVERCPNCGARIVLQANERHPEDYCFVCNPNPINKGKVRVSTAEPLQYPSPERMKEVLDEVLSARLTAVHLVQCGARPQEVEIFVPGQKTFASEIWPILLGTPAPQGGLPFTVLFYVEKLERRRHAAYVIKTFQKLQKLGFSGADLFIALFQSYLSLFGDTPEAMHFSRVRGIIHFYTQNELKPIKCADCGAEYVILSDELPGDQSCPSCRVMSQLQRDENLTPRKTIVRRNSLPPLPGDIKRRRPKLPPQTVGFCTGN